MSGKKILVNLRNQKLSAYENDQKVYEFGVVTNTSNRPTLPGKFKILRKEEKCHSRKYDVDMPYSMFFSED